jgi:type I restriction enzyme S subunit
MRMPSCYPPLAEQAEIADAVDQRCGDIDESSKRVRQGIALLREYRTRLIADVVTGKLDVRDAAGRLVAETEEPELHDEAGALTDAEDDTADDLDTAVEEIEV